MAAIRCTALLSVVSSSSRSRSILLAERQVRRAGRSLFARGGLLVFVGCPELASEDEGAEAP